MLEELLRLGGGKLLVPLVVVVAGASIAKGLFGLQRSRSADRRDFLDVFKGWEGQSDLWLSAAVRHLFGSYLPPSLIRQLMSGRQPGRAILEVSTSWDFLDMDDETEGLRWRRPHFSNPRFRKRIGIALTVFYLISASCALFLSYAILIGGFSHTAAVIGWVYVGFGLFGAFVSLMYQESLRAAGKAANRWLGLP